MQICQQAKSCLDYIEAGDGAAVGFKDIKTERYFYAMKI
jgi:hypothetical protein